MLRFARLCVPRKNIQRRFLNIHEYQSKALLKEHGCSVEYGIPCTTLAAVEAACAKIKTEKKVVKSQILAGGRGKGTFKDGYKGGVKVCANTADAMAAAKAMLGNTLITKQTGPAGQKVETLYITEAIPQIKRELYISLILDRKSASPMFIGSAEGGMAIEDLARDQPEKIKTLAVNVAEGVDKEACVKYAVELGFSGESAVKAAEQLVHLYNVGKSKDCTMVEINPLVELEDGNVMMLDAKLGFDDNAAHRQKDIFMMEDRTHIDEKEVIARKYDLNYIALNGNVGCLVNGAGLAMATMDLISTHGGSPANFLDVGGSATEAQIVASLNIITHDPKVKSILVNIFGGIMKCDVIASGVVKAAHQLKVPLVVRLSGTNEELGRKILEESEVQVHAAKDFDTAARLAVELAKASA